MRRNGFEEMMEERRRYGRTKTYLMPLLTACIGVAGTLVVKGWDRHTASVQADHSQDIEITHVSDRIEGLQASVVQLSAEEAQWRDTHTKFSEAKISDFQHQLDDVKANQASISRRLDMVFERADAAADLGTTNNRLLRQLVKEHN